MTIRRAMVLAAGRGERLRPLTDSVPKPLVEVAGVSLLDRMLDRLAGMELVVVNAWHLAGQIDAHLACRASPPHTRVLHERELLDTGGGVRNALPYLGEAPFLVCAGDVLLTEGPQPATTRLAEAWDDATMDVLMLLQPREAAGGFRGRGDFFREADGRLWRNADAASMPFVYASLQVIHPWLFEGAPEGSFSLNKLWDRAAAAGRLRGIVHGGGWFTVDTPENLRTAPAWLASHGA